MEDSRGVGARVRRELREGADRWIVAGLILGFGLATAVLLAWNGVRLGGDSPRYIAGAAALLGGHAPEGKATSYLGYLVAVAAMQKLGTGLNGVVALQFAVAALATAVLYRLARKLCRPVPAGIAASLFALNPDIGRWHAYILTDSLYISLVILATYAVYRASEQRGHSYLGASLLVLAAASTRPHGWVLVPVTMAFWALRAPIVRTRRRILASVLVVACGVGVFVLPGTRHGAERESLDVKLRRGEVIWGYPQGRISMPADRSTRTGLPTAIGYAARHPLATARLAVWRVGTELVHARPFYSRRHNLFAIGLVCIVYVFAVVGAISTRGDPLTRMLLAVIGAHLFVVAATFADWDGRFLLYVFPLIGVLAGCGIGPVYRSTSLLRSRLRARARP